MNAVDVLNLLLKRYPSEKFVNVPECKTGETFSATRTPRFDLWTMARSWAHPRFIGSEIKVARNDFMTDTKWPSYLPFCTEFYFVTAPGIVKQGEIPEDAGWMEVSKNLKTVLTRKKAPVRRVQIPESIFIYILMCRSKIVFGTDSTISGRELWTNRLEEINGNKRLGWEVAEKIRLLVKKDVNDIIIENNKLKKENEALAYIKDSIQNLGINIDEGLRPYQIERKLKDIFSNPEVERLKKEIDLLMNVASKVRTLIQE